MRKLLLVLVATAALSVNANADSVGACPANATLQELINLGGTGCIVGNIFVNNFSYTAAGANGGVPLTAAEVSVLLGQPLIPGQGDFLTFVGPWNVGIPGQVNNQEINFQIGWSGYTIDGSLVSCAHVSASAGSNDEVFTGSSVANFVIANVTGGDANGISDGGCSLPDIGAGGFVDVTMTGNFTFVDIAISIDAFQPPPPPTPVPEPTTFALVGSGLAGLALKLRKQCR